MDKCVWTDEVECAMAAERAAAGTDEPMATCADHTVACADCDRPITYDYDTEAWKHLTSPERGCFLIRPDAYATLTAEVSANLAAATR